MSDEGERERVSEDPPQVGLGFYRFRGTCNSCASSAWRGTLFAHSSSMCHRIFFIAFPFHSTPLTALATRQPRRHTSDSVTADTTDRPCHRLSLVSRVTGHVGRRSAPPPYSITVRGQFRRLRGRGCVIIRRNLCIYATGDAYTHPLRILN